MSDEADDPPEVYCRHLILCRSIWFDGNLDEGFSLGRLVVQLRPDEGRFPFVTGSRLFLFAQLFGTPGEYTARVRLVSVTLDEVGEESSEEVNLSGPWTVPVYGEELVDGVAFPLVRLPFDRPGLYEFQLLLDEVEGPVAAERVAVLESKR